MGIFATSTLEYKVSSKDIVEVTGPLKEEILNGSAYTIDDMKAWLGTLGYSDAINDAAINLVLREFVMSTVSIDKLMNADMILKLLCPQLEVTKEDVDQSLSWDYTIIETL